MVYYYTVWERPESCLWAELRCTHMPLSGSEKAAWAAVLAVRRGGKTLPASVQQALLTFFETHPGGCGARHGTWRATQHAPTLVCMFGSR